MPAFCPETALAEQVLPKAPAKNFYRQSSEYQARRNPQTHFTLLQGPPLVVWQTRVWGGFRATVQPRDAEAETLHPAPRFLMRSRSLFLRLGISSITADERLLKFCPKGFHLQPHRLHPVQKGEARSGLLSIGTLMTAV